MALFDTTRARATNKNSGGHRFTGISPPRGFGPPPLRESVAGREYHCRLTRSASDESVPPLLPDGKRTAHHHWPSFAALAAAVGHRASSGVACPYRAHQLTYSSRYRSASGVSMFREESNLSPHRVGSEKSFLITKSQKLLK